MISMSTHLLLSITERMKKVRRIYEDCECEENVKRDP